jgi:glycosyltransferase involved in cell wall biosynthesis
VSHLELDMLISVIIPALNEEVTVGTVVAAVPSAIATEVIVVDNGSTDRTAEVASAAGAHVVVEPRRGYGAACLAGVRAAHGQVLVFMDGDGSFDPQEIAALVHPIAAERADLVLGSRELEPTARGAVLPHQRFGNWLSVHLLRLGYGLQVTDLGPFRAIQRDILLRMRMSEPTYGWPVEMMIKAQWLGCRIVEVPVHYHSRLGGRSKVSGTLRGSMLAGYHILRVVWRYRVNGAGARAVRDGRREVPGAS